MSFWMWLQGCKGASMEFNWDDYWTDIGNGVSNKKILKKHKTDAYMTKPISR